MVPIVGWSSNVQMSSDTDTRVVSFNGTQSSQAITGGTTDITFTSVKDGTGSWNGTQFKVPVSGDYFVSGNISNSGTGTFLAQVYLNGTQYQSVFGESSSNSLATVAGLLTSLSAGALISLRSNITGTISNGQLNIFRLSGPSVIAATESVNASYVSSLTSSIPNGTSSIVFPTKLWDTHGAYNSSTGVFTAPVSGKYRISAAISVNIANNLTSDGIYAVVTQAGSTSIGKVLSNSIGNGAGGAVTYMNSGSATFNCLAGDALSIAVINNGPTGSISNGSEFNHFEIERVGN